MPGFILKKGKTSDQADECVVRCEDGFFPYFTKSDNITTMYLDKQTCMPCHESCYTCKRGDAYNCTSCAPNHYFELLMEEVGTG